MNKYFRVKTLINVLKQYDNIIIYGSGQVSKYIYPYLVQYGVKEKIFCFTQTNECEAEMIDGIPVFQITVLDCRETDCVVLIAASEQYVDAMRKSAYAQGFSDIVSLMDYRTHTEQDFLKSDTFQGYCQLIAEWYIEQYEQRDRLSLIEQLCDSGNRSGKNKDQKLIVVICGSILPRMGDILRALELKGYRMVVLSYGPIASYCRNALNGLNAVIYHCACIEEMLYMALRYTPLVYYFEPSFADCLWARIMFRYKNHFGKVVLTLYDVTNDGYYGATPERLEMEKYALENADGIVWRWYSKEYLEKKGFCFQGKSIQFLDYCSSTDMDWLKVDSKSCVLRLCMAAGCDAHFLKDRECDFNYTRMAKIEEVLEKVGNREDCIFHFYAGNLSEEGRAKCLRFEKQYKNFKFFLNTEYTDLVKKFREYDYACNLYTKGELPPEDCFIDGTTGSSFRNYVRHSFFDYLSAGLPIIATIPQKCLEYLQQYDVVIRMDVSDLDLEYLKQNRQYYADKVKKAVKELDINKHIPKLIDFFNEL